MKKLYLSLLLIFCITFSTAISICIDKTAPTPPANLSISGSVGNIQLAWESSTDTPSCSGVDHYVISRDGIQLGTTTALTFTDNEILYFGNYTYTVFAVDIIAHNSGNATQNKIIIYESPNGTVSLGGGSSHRSSTCTENWECEEWSDCVGEEQRRVCADTYKCGTTNNKPVTYFECGDDGQGNFTILTNANDISDITPDYLSAITGAAIGAIRSKAGITVSSFIAVIILGFIAIRIKTKFSK